MIRPHAAVRLKTPWLQCVHSVEAAWRTGRPFPAFPLLEPRSAEPARRVTGPADGPARAAD